MTSTNPIDEYIERQDPARKGNLCCEGYDPEGASRSRRADFLVNAYMVEEA